ncbi:alkaline phosphatase D family protein [Sinimarinibacterium flocculans]|uniref:Alkaline phosphatase D n=1 Tax=Sinimarinibacterium flocculans TaxID=985250 RepID=A0A318EAE6_9GAMM|nr:alkaline phosphatase D family protein [Sinimarinibacterium flocculans]PXV66535.1 alkaline phosphatase D [Sinimarinibacterium flocculans]
MARPPTDPQRRRVLLASAGLLGLPAAGCMKTQTVRVDIDPFSLGVAAGDPVADGFVIWTRLAPNPLDGGGMDPVPVEVVWEVAEDEAFRKIASAGTAVAEPAWAHSLHVEVEGLKPDRWYWYRFRYGAAISPVGRARTAPVLWSAIERLRFAYASCQHYEHGHYAAWRHLAAESPDLILHLGDYIYETSSPRAVRRHETAREPQTLDAYRNRYARYRLDPDLQAAHAACAWLVTWDDHEVDNDYAGPYSQDRDPVDAFLLRRAAAYQAYWEHLPLRNAMRPQGARLPLFQRRGFGDLVMFHVLDTRQYRDDQACATPERGGARVVAPCAQMLDPSRCLLGTRQENWLLHGLSGSPARWNLVAQAMLMAPLDQTPGPEVGVWTDGWDGYPAARERILRHLAQRRTANPVVIGGDIHSFWATELSAGGERDPVATEFVGSSISSHPPPHDRFAAMLAENPHVRFFDARPRGYVRCELTPERLDVSMRAISDAGDPQASVSTLAAFVVESGRARVQSA